METVKSNYSLVGKVESNFNIGSIQIGFSKFDDDTWNFFDENLERHYSDKGSNFRIEWKKFKRVLDPLVILQLKLLGYYYYHGVTVSKTLKKKKAIKDKTFCHNCRNILNLFVSIFMERAKRGHNLNSSIANIAAKDIQFGLDTYKYSKTNGIKEFLLILCNEEIKQQIKKQTNFSFNINWNEYDIEQITLPKFKPRKSKYQNGSVISDDLVTFLIKKSSSDVKSLLQRLNISCFDEMVYVTTDTINFSTDIDILNAFNDYRDFRIYNLEQMKKRKNRHYSIVSKEISKKFKAKYKINTTKFRKELERIQFGARYIVMQFTGARYSEVISFKNGCVHLKDGNYFIKGTLIKNVSDRAVTGTDYWVAIPIVRDAIRVLELITSYTLNDYLFAPNHSVVLNVKNRPLANNSMIGMLNSYLCKIDLNGKYTYLKEFTNSKKGKRIIKCVKPEYKLSPHRIRHTLAIQFLKHRANLVVISYHFKHAYLAVKLYNIPNETTLGYGNIANEIFTSPIYNNEFKRELIESIYSPKAVIVGEGAPNFLKYRMDFFAGEIQKGKTEKEIMNDLIKRDLPFADVGLGLCGGKNTFQNDEGVEVQPPCIGQLQCNPLRCKNAIIPKYKIEHWLAHRNKNQEMLDSGKFPHAKEYLNRQIEEANLVLTKLEINGNT
ncbi:MAG: tyrosine-type recombinase/integrase [Cyclobacteriaceae bacterium]|nr:tyrosine-type recombinase/integrase [Cytophagales bacterium]MCZ8328242.1 tyrosine-type recombinase/integrase [Cyclobacteriaceae bacterium]